MKLTAYLFITFLLGATLTAAEPKTKNQQPTTSDAPRPNVIVLITDDQGYGDLSAHGNPVLKTPNMDRLHAESVRLTDFHVAPMCSPTRGQLMTGLDAMRNGCTAVCQGRSMPRADIPMMANYFADSGYTTGHFGKWHLGDSYPFRPQDRGFQETIHHRAWGITSLADYWQNTYFDPVLEHNGVDKKFEGYCTDIFFDESMKWIKKQITKNQQPTTDGSAAQPFFLYLPTNTPHVPNVCPEEYSAPYTGVTHDGHPAPDTFYGMIANLDDNLGRLEAFLTENQLRDNTILVFLSDNGTQSKGAQALYNAGMRDKKTSVFEGGHRVPCFIRWPEGDLQHGTNIDTLTQVQDLLPTLMEFCDLEDKGIKLDGSSLAGPLQGKKKTLPDRKLVIQYKVSGEPWDPAVVLWDKWRLIRGTELYQVSNDPGQASNVAEQHPEVVSAMNAHYNSWHEEVKPIYDTPRWITVGSPKANPMILYAQDWTGDYCDNRGGLTQGTALGYWNVIVDQPGIYEIELRRYAKESNKTFTESVEGPENEGRGARPVAATNLRVAGGNYTINAPAGSTHTTFQVRLPAGKTQINTALLDSGDRSLCSAMYVYLKRHQDGADITLSPPSDRQAGARVPVAPAPQKGKSKDNAKGKAMGNANAKTAQPAQPVKLAPGDRLLADFEGPNYGEWTLSGGAFGEKPSAAIDKVTGQEGRQLVDTFVTGGGDRPTGTLTSPPFTIEHSHLNFLIGGGKHADTTCVNLIVEDEVVKTATGPASKDSQKRKIMERVSWNIQKWAGKEARLQIVDNATAGWGHIVVDHIFLSNSSEKKHPAPLNQPLKTNH